MVKTRHIVITAGPSQVVILINALSAGAPALLTRIEKRLGLVVNCVNASGYGILPDPTRSRKTQPRPPQAEVQVEVLRQALSLGAPDLLVEIKDQLGLVIQCLNARGYRIARPSQVAPAKESK